MYTVVWAKYKGASTQGLTKRGVVNPLGNCMSMSELSIFGMYICVYCVSVSNCDQPCKWRWRHSHISMSATMLLCYDVVALLKHWRSHYLRRRRRGGADALWYMFRSSTIWIWNSHTDLAALSWIPNIQLPWTVSPMEPLISCQENIGMVVGISLSVSENMSDAVAFNLWTKFVIGLTAAI